MTGEPYQRAKPSTGARGRLPWQGRVFDTAIGDRPENWSEK